MRSDDAAARAAALAAYGILDTDPEPEFDDLVALAAQICAVPISAVSLLDRDRQWFKAELGLGVQETEIESSFCAHAVLAGPDVFEVGDATADDRFAGNRFVLGDPRVRFYAGAPMLTADGTSLGTVCVIDRQPRHLDAEQRAGLARLARQAVALLEARRVTPQVSVPAQAREQAPGQAAERAGRFQVAFASSPVGMLLCDPQGTIVEANAAFAAMLGHGPAGLAGVAVSTLVDRGALAGELELFAEAVAGTRDSAERETGYRHRDGYRVRAVTRTSVLRDTAAALTGFLSQVQSVEERRHAEDALLQTQSTNDAIISIDSASRIIAWNAGAEKVFGWTADAAIGHHLDMIIPERSRPAHAGGVARVSGGAPSRLAGRTMQLAGLRADGTEFPVELAVSAWQRRGQPCYTAILRDVSEREALHAAVLAQATTDPLTGLPNRSGLIDALSGLLTDPGAVPVSVITFDIDAFTEINATLGPAVGDRVLTRTGQLLRAALRGGEVVARTGGDEFTVLLPATSAADARKVACRLQRALCDAPVSPTAPAQIDTCAGVGTIGKAVAPVAARRSAATGLRNATLALADARRAGPRTIRAYHPTLITSARRRRTLQTALQQALSGDELTLAYQPQVDLRTGQIRAVEALARWHHPDLGPITPDEFIPLAENSGLMPTLGAWALHTACTAAAAWRTDGLPHIGISVNVSARQLGDDDIIGVVTHALTASGLPASALTLEITESVLITDPTRTARRLNILKQLGVQIAVDDFGTGYSSLTSLTTFPVDELKIDRAFVAPLPDDDNALRIVTAVTALAGSLGLRTVAEGIETPEQARILRGLGVTLGQGYLYARAVPADEIPPLLHQTPTRHLNRAVTIVGRPRPSPDVTSTNTACNPVRPGEASAAQESSDWSAVVCTITGRRAAGDADAEAPWVVSARCLCS